MDKIKIWKYDNLVVAYFVVSPALVLMGFIFWWILQLVDGFIRSEPWQGWMFLPWLIVLVYALMGWVFSIGLTWVSFLGPVILPFALIRMAIKRRKVTWEASRRQVMYQSRKLARTFKEGRFGRVELESFLAAVHIALALGVPPLEIEDWVMQGFSHANVAAGVIDVMYPSKEAASLPHLLLNGKEVVVR